MTLFGRARSASAFGPRAWLAAACLIFVYCGAAVSDTRASDAAEEFARLKKIYEPSGVVQLSGGSLLVVEDESNHPFSLLTPADGDRGFEVEALGASSLHESLFIRVEDLEGVAAGSDGLIYAVTSHSRRRNGKRQARREQLVRFVVEGGKLARWQTVTSLRKALTTAFPDLDEAAKERKVKREGGLNIEGLALAPGGRRLWLGFRGPVVDHRALLVAIENPDGIFAEEAIRFSPEPVTLDLDGGGIRALAYVPRLGGYLLVSQREGTKKEKAFKLWLWPGEPGTPAVRVRIAGVSDLERTEGIAPVRLGGQEKVLLVSDDGDRSHHKAARYLMVDYASLEISTPIETAPDGPASTR